MPTEPTNKTIQDEKSATVKKKYWRIKSADDARKILQFFPIFLVNPETQEVECKELEMKFIDTKGKEHDFKFDWLNIYMFVYFTCNEELRRQLATRYERKINYIPYDLTITIDDEEAKTRSARRRVQLPIDEKTMAIAREQAWILWSKKKDNWGDPRAFHYKGGKKQGFT